MASKFRFDVKSGQPVKVCVHCGQHVSLGASGKVQMEFTFQHVVKHSKGPIFVNKPATK